MARRVNRRRTQYKREGGGLFRWLILGLIILGIYMTARTWLSWNRPNSDDSSIVTFTVAQGTSASAIAEQLEQLGLIRDSLPFKLYVKYNNLSPQLQAGDFSARRDLTYTELMDVLGNGRSVEVKVTIPEGLTIAQIDELMAKKGLTQAGEIIKCATSCPVATGLDNLEGFLFPSTYSIVADTITPESFISRLYNTFKAQMAPLEKEIAASGRTMDQIVNVASMIERETRKNEEMPIVSGVIWKRLDEGIPLGIDATTRYELNNWDKPLYTKDFETNSGYNTRRVRGLPPTAIANPGYAALEAAVRPQTSEWYYYLHDNNGIIRYARTNDEHNKNRAQYLQ